MDKRQSPRKELRIKAVMTMDGGMPMTVRTMDVGKFGMSLVGILKQLTVGQEVGVTFDMPFAGKIHTVAVNAKVSHCMDTKHDGFKAGLQFINLDSDGVALLAEYIGQ